MFIELAKTPELPEIELVLPARAFVAGDGVTAVALVKEPAIGVEFVMFAEDATIKEEDILVHFDAEKGIVTGPLLIPGKRIKRNNKPEEFPQGYNVFLSAETIAQTMELFFAQGNMVNLNIMHDPRLRPNGFISEAWIMTDKANDKSNIWFSKQDLPVGTSFISVKLQDEATKKLVRQGLLGGFSIEGLFVRDNTTLTAENGTKHSPSTQTNMSAEKEKENFVKQFVKFFTEGWNAPAPTQPAAAPVVTVKDANGNEVMLQADANGQIQARLADGTTTCLQVAQPGGAAHQASGEGTAPVKEPMEEAALSKANNEVAELKSIILKLSSRVENQAAIIKEMDETPASEPAKEGGKTTKKPEAIRESFGKTASKEPLSLNQQIEQDQEERRQKKAEANKK